MLTSEQYKYKLVLQCAKLLESDIILNIIYIDECLMKILLEGILLQCRSEINTHKYKNATCLTHKLCYVLNINKHD